MADQWNYLVSETQFATELVVSGVRKLCTVPIRDDNWPVSHSQMYPLHVGLHSYTSGLERLAKLTIACHGFLATGAFASVRSYGHKISDLLDGVEGLDMSLVPGMSKIPPRRPVDGLDPTMTEALERFANGAGRYEHLDSLWKPDTDVSTLRTWHELCGQVKGPERLRDLISLRNTVVERVRMLCTHGHLEGATYTLLEPAGVYLSELSSVVALRLYEKARWVALTLDGLTYYTGDVLPLLGEAVGDITPAAEGFFQYSVTLIEDEQAAIECLEAHFEEFGHLDDDEDEDYEGPFADEHDEVEDPAQGAIAPPGL